jgi:hypothetical protein
MTNYLHHLHTYLLPLADPAPVPPAGGAADPAVVDPAVPAAGAGAGAAPVQQVMDGGSHTGWTIGYILFIVVVLVVVALVVPIIALAGRIGHQAPAINEALQISQKNTADIPALNETIDHARVITAGLYRARARLGG